MASSTSTINKKSKLAKQFAAYTFTRSYPRMTPTKRAVAVAPLYGIRSRV